MNGKQQWQADGDLRLGALLNPISNLLLEDEIPSLENLYQFDTDGNKDEKHPRRGNPP